MAALLVDEQAFSITALMEHCVAHLPSFAVPVFFRLTSSFENTGTFKIQKHNMQIEGYAPDNGDAIWYFMQQEHELIPLTDRIRDALRTGFMP